MTQEEKAKCYDEVIEIAKKWHNAPNVDKIPTFANRVIEELFPELKESEDERKDERIRKDIIWCLKHSGIKEGNPINPYVTTIIKDALTWLEKQGEKSVDKLQVSGELYEHIRNTCACIDDAISCNSIKDMKDYLAQAITDANIALDMVKQKPADKVRPKFEIGDSIKTTNEGPITITEITDSGYWSEDLFICSFEDSTKWELDEKLVDKVEPKFKVGDWVVYQNQTFQVTKGSGNNLILQGRRYQTYFIEELCKPWNISDAKPGDVLYSPTHRLIWIYKDTKHYYTALNLNYADTISFEGNIVIPSDVCPANNVQRNILFQKMEEAGYMWDAEKKELKKVKKNDYEPDVLIEESYQQQADDLIDMVTEKPAWSKEDEEYLQDAINYFNIDDALQHSTKDIINWLKSLKERIVG